MGLRLRPLGAGQARGLDPRAMGWHRFCGHTHMMRGPLRPPESLRSLVAWCRSCGIDLLGVGSPWTPGNEATYTRYEGPDRALYYSGAVDQRGLREVSEVAGLIDELNALSGGSTRFVLDNETPKGRYGHLWWVGWSYDYPAWHDYDQPYDRWMLGIAALGHFLDEPMPYERRPYLEILGSQRSAGALGIWAHPTSWWWSPQRTFVTNIASEMPFHLLAEGSVDGMAIMSYKAWQQSALDLWFRVLDMGYRVPGLAEIDIGLCEEEKPGAPYFTSFASADSRPDGRAAADAVRAGRVSASNGPFVEVELDGSGMGSAAPCPSGSSHRLRLLASMGHGSPCTVRIISNGGRTVWEQRGFPGGSVDLEISEVDAPTWLVCCVFDDGVAHPGDARYVAIANPVRLEPPGSAAPAPVRTELGMHFGTHSPWIGGRLELETSAGALLESWGIVADRLRAPVPAASRIRLRSVDGWTETAYLLNLNPEVQRLQRSLYRGRFLRDFPGVAPGEVPVEAFDFARFRSAIESLTLEW